MIGHPNRHDEVLCRCYHTEPAPARRNKEPQVSGWALKENYDLPQKIEGRHLVDVIVEKVLRILKPLF